jgi:hypothetical protein
LLLLDLSTVEKSRAGQQPERGKNGKEKNKLFNFLFHLGVRHDSPPATCVPFQFNYQAS